MRERPILFSTPMVQATLADKKTKTRRIVKWQPYHEGESINFNFSGMSLGHYCTGVPESGYVLYSRGGGGCWNQRTKPIHCPYGKPGDILWVRETWCDPTSDQSGYPILYKADMPMHWDAANTEQGDEVTLNAEDYKWRPSIFMPREVCRIKLRITNIKVERLQDISEEDAKAEGVSLNYGASDERVCRFQKYRDAFRALWDSLNKKRGYGWRVNPWVWVVEFERVTE